jgi:hypothetical protein
LANRAVGQYLNRHFVSAFQKVATFQVDGRQKQGGNVAAYFCTPEGQVLHAVAGPVDAGTFLREARWANETYQLARLEKKPLPAFFRKAHLGRLLQEQRLDLAEDRLPRPDAVTPEMLDQLLDQNQHLGLTNQGKVHLLLTVAPLARLGDVYRPVFERILNEKVSTNPVAVRGR